LHDAADKTPGARGAWIRMRFAGETVAPAVAADKSSIMVGG
jgi:hypothetical protein